MDPRHGQVYRDRREAGRLLAEALAGFARCRPVVLALPRGGVPVAAEIASALAAPLDLMLVRKIGVPRRPELAMGAIAEGEPPVTVRNHNVLRALHIAERDFESARGAELAELERRRRTYLAERPRLDIAGRTVILVDDGIATGMTIRAAGLAADKRHACRVVIAAPVAGHDIASDLRREFADVVCLAEPEDLRAVGAHYGDFSQLRDEDVRAILASCDAGAAAAAPAPTGAGP